MRSDLRLLPAAIATWAAAWALTRWTGAAPAVLCGSAGGVLASAVALLAARASARRTARVAAQALLVAGAVAAVTLGAVAHVAAREPVTALAAQRADAVLAGRVVADGTPSPFGAGQVWSLDADTVTARAVTTAVRARVEVSGAEAAPPYGARAVVHARLATADPAVEDAARATATDVEVVRRPPAALRATNALRAALLGVTADLSPQAQGLVPGIAVGDTSRMPPDLGAAFKATGLTHLTAVSGGHFAIVLTLVTAFAGMVRAPRWVRVLLVVAIATGFVLLMRPEPSVQRAAAMCAVTVLGVALGRPAASMPSLAACTMVLLCADPWLARSFGFALSCAATGGLVLLVTPLVRRLTPWLGRAGALALAVPLAAQLACGPVLVLLSPAVPTVSVLANLLAAPAVAPATLLGLAATLTAPWWPWGAHALAWTAGGATWWVAAVARWCSALPGAALPWPGGPWGALAMAGATALLLVLVLRRAPGEGWPLAWSEGGRRARRAAGAYVRAALVRRRHGLLTRRDRRLALVAAAAVILLVTGTTTAVVRVLPTRGRVPADWQVVACDVGQGDSMAVRTGPASAVVIDTGPEGDAAGRCLDRLGVTRIDLLVLTHEHLDHIGGLAAVLAGRDVRAAWVSKLDQPAANARRVSDELAGAGVTRRVPDVGETVHLASGGWQVDLRVLGTGIASGGKRASVSRGSAEGDGINDSSIALDVVTSGPGGGMDLVALGDLEQPGQDALLTSLQAGGPPGVLDGVDVVKVAHHGSASQSARLARLLHPRVALVSVGAGNTYGHPTASMLDLYAGVGSRTVRTDRCGSAVLVVRGGAMALACT